MSGLSFAKSAVPAGILAAFLMAGPAGAQPRPPGPPPMMRPPGLPPLGGPVGAPVPGGAFGRPPSLPLGPTPIVRPDLAQLPPPTGLRPGGWTPPAGNPGWAPPGPNPVSGPNPPFNGGIPPNGTRTNPVTGSGGGVNGFAGGWAGLYTASGAAGGYASYHGGGEGRGGHTADYGGRWGWGEGPQFWGGWVSGSAGDSGSGYSNPYYYPASSYSDSYTGSVSNSGNPYYVSVPVYSEVQGSNGSSAAAVPTEQDDTASGKADVANSRDEIPAEVKQHMEVARTAFRKGDFASAQKECEQAIPRLPGDANLREFRALCQFAQGQYKDAAAALYEVLASGPGWSWKTLSSFYPGAQAYTRQLRALEQHVREHPGDAAGRFVLSYHYLVLDERDAALNHLKEVVKLQPRDKVSAGILEVLEKARKAKEAAQAEKPSPER